MAAPITRDYFAELYVAGLFGDSGWSVYFPKRDVGFDFIVTKSIDGHVLLRPVQVKGLYPTSAKTDKRYYGYDGMLTAVHPQLVLVLPYFRFDNHHYPEQIAFMPFDRVKNLATGNFRCLPARFEGGHARPRRDFADYFGRAGLSRIEFETWGCGA